MRSIAVKFVLLNCFVWSLLLTVASCAGGGGTKWFPNCSLTYATPNYAQATDPKPGGALNKLRWWSGFPLKVWINPSGVTGYGFNSEDLINTALARWPAATSNGVQFIATNNQSEAHIEIAMVEQTSPLGDTISTVNQVTGEVVKARIAISWWQGMTIEQFRDGLKATIAHEVGHALYLKGHSENSGDLMWWTNNSSFDKAITSNDINTILTAYCGDFQTRGRAPAGEWPEGVYVEEKSNCIPVSN